MTNGNALADQKSTPAGWQVCRLSEVTSRVTVGFVGSMSHLFREKGVPLLRGTNVRSGHLDMGELRFISQDTHRRWNKSSLAPGDLVMVRVGYPGRTAVVPPTLPRANAASLVIASPRKGVLDAHFAMYVINSPGGQREIQAGLVGGAQQVFNTTLASSFPLLLPPYEEQRRIARVLLDADDLCSSLECLLAKRQAIKQGVLQGLLTAETRLPGFADKWRTSSLGDLGRTYGGLTGKTADDFGRGAGRYVTFMDVMSNVRIDGSRLARVQLSPCERQNEVRSGDILLNGSSETPDELAMAAVVVDVPAGTLLNSFCFGFRPNGGAPLVPEFLAHLLRAEPGRRLLSSTAQGATRYNLSKKQFLRLRICLPSLAEQRAIAGTLRDIDDEVEELERRLAKARELKLGMMQELLTGRTRLVPQGVST